jgi:hypothetical protein
MFGSGFEPAEAKPGDAAAPRPNMKSGHGKPEKAVLLSEILSYGFAVWTFIRLIARDRFRAGLSLDDA